MALTGGTQEASEVLPAVSAALRLSDSHRGPQSISKHGLDHVTALAPG